MRDTRDCHKLVCPRIIRPSFSSLDSVRTWCVLDIQRHLIDQSTVGRAWATLLDRRDANETQTSLSDGFDRAFFA